MSQSAKNPWSTGDAAERAAAEADVLEAEAKTTESETDADRHFDQFARMMRAIGGGAEEGSKLTPAEQLQRLQTFAQRYVTPATQRFKIGDVITPAKASNIRGHGRPHVVVEVVDRPSPVGLNTAHTPGTDNIGPGSSGFGLLFDLRIIGLDSGDSVCPHWVESWAFETWTPPATNAN